MTDQAQELTALKVKTTDEQRNVVRFQQKVNGIPIIGSEIVVQMDSAMNLMSISGELMSAVSVDTTPSITTDAAAQTALAKAAEKYQKNVSELVVSTPELRIYNPVILGLSQASENILVWRTEVKMPNPTPFKELVLIDAHSGAIVLNFNQIDSAMQRLTYNATNTSSVFLCRSEGQAATGDADCDKAHDYAGDTYAFYKREHNRDSIDNAGMKLFSYVHVPQSFFGGCNACWDGEEMIYADGCGIITDDIVAHEMTHGVTQYESGLIYASQSGAINESFSDIWGEFVDQTNVKGNDTASVRWLIGEEYVSGGGRDMKNPPARSQPDKITSSLYKYCGCTTPDQNTNDNCGVHYNSGVGNKAAYLMTDGDTFNGYTVVGLGYAKVAKLFYEAQANILTSSAKYSDLYNALLLACSNLQYSASDCQQVQNALDAVEMYLQPCQPAYPVISGYVKDSSGNPISGVKITFTNGMGSVTTNASGFYSRKVNGSWSGSITPSKTGSTFNPPSRSYSGITSNMSNQDYTTASTSCSYSVSPTIISVGSFGRNGSITVTGSGGCNWTAAANSSWISILSGSSGNGNGTVSYSVSPNTATGSRNSTITVAGKTVTVVQSGLSCPYSINPTNQTFGPSGGNGSITVTDSGGCGWDATSNAIWITIMPGNADTVNYSVAPNTGSSRTGTITIAGKSFTVAQNNTTDFTNSLGMTFKQIPAGTFMMGSLSTELGRYDNEIQHQVTISKSFYMQSTEVTQGQWKAVMGTNPSYFSTCGDNCPVENMSWDELQAFITKMNQRGDGIYRLPTEAEWEYAARALSTTAFANGHITNTECSPVDPKLDAMGWYCSNSGNKTHPVAQKQANTWGLYDMHGNVWELCQDWYGIYSATITDPAGPSYGMYRVARGGDSGADGYAKYSRSAQRGTFYPSGRSGFIGFRLAFSPKDKADFSNSLNMNFKLIPGGTFTMGSPSTEPGRQSDEVQHQVTLTKPFYIQTTEVTQGQWKAVMGSSWFYFPNCGDNCPAESVSYDDAQAFVAKLNQRGEGIYRLPTEAEWEYAARAGTTTAFANGNITNTECSPVDPNLDAMGWYCGNAADKTHPVAQKQANAWGLSDMYGNIWELVQDWYGSYPTGAVIDPLGPASGSNRLTRGGCYGNPAMDNRSATRLEIVTSDRYSGVGLRVVRVIKEKGYELFWDGVRVGYEANWTREQGIQNLNSNKAAYPEKKVEGYYDGEPL